MSFGTEGFDEADMEEERQFDDDIPYTAVTTPGERILAQITLLTEQLAQLQHEATITRVMASDACSELIAHCQKHEPDDALLNGLAQSENPFKESKGCKIL